MRSRSKPVSDADRRRPRSAGLVVFAALLIQAAAAPADSTGDHDLVVLAEPQPNVGLATGAAARDVVVDYRIVEVFHGEPDSTQLVVLHRRLDADQRALLAGTPRVIVFASEDADSRWVGPLPLRATPAAVEAFRDWSAPPDVRPPRAVDEVIAEVATDVTFAARGEAPPAAPPVRPGDDAPARTDVATTTKAEATTVAPSASVDRSASANVDRSASANVDRLQRSSAPEAQPAATTSTGDERPRTVVATSAAPPSSPPSSPATSTVAAAASTPSSSSAASTTRDDRGAPTASPERVAAERPIPSPPGHDDVVATRAPWGGSDERARVATASPTPWSPSPPTSAATASRSSDGAPVNRLQRARPGADGGPAPPLLYDPELVPVQGQPLPPAPPAEPLGPVAAQRDDLRRPGSERRPSIAHGRSVRASSDPPPVATRP